MADPANKYPENVEGQFYVDDQCIDCDLCRETAPANFKRNDDGGHSFVYKQPESPEEEALCKEAMEGCPVEAIGPDGAAAFLRDVGGVLDDLLLAGALLLLDSNGLAETLDLLLLLEDFAGDLLV